MSWLEGDTDVLEKLQGALTDVGLPACRTQTHTHGLLTREKEARTIQRFFAALSACWCLKSHLHSQYAAGLTDQMQYWLCFYCRRGEHRDAGAPGEAWKMKLGWRTWECRLLQPQRTTFKQIHLPLSSKAIQTPSAAPATDSSIFSLHTCPIEHTGLVLGLRLNLTP